MNKLFRKAFGILLPVLPVNPRKIFVKTNYGRGYGCNPKYIVAELLRRNLDYEIYWSVRKVGDHNDLPPEVHQVQLDSLAELYHQSTARFWVDNARKTPYGLKKKSQIYIQTWHNGTRLKRVEGDAEDKLGASYIRMAKRDSRMIDLFLSGSRAASADIRRAFWYQGPILEGGTPRNDVLFHQDRQALRQKVQAYCPGLPADAKIVMYAPTFRRDKRLDLYNLDYEGLLGAIANRFGGKWCLFLRLHPNLLDKNKDLVLPENVPAYNLTEYNDMQELLSVADVLVTDYSSSMFDFTLTERPCFLYTPDKDTYDRGTYYQLEDLPFPHAVEMAGVLSNIENFDEPAYREEVQRLNREVIGSFENGTAASQVVDYIERHTKKSRPSA